MQAQPESIFPCTAAPHAPASDRATPEQNATGDRLCHNMIEIGENDDGDLRRDMKAEWGRGLRGRTGISPEIFSPG